MKKLSLIACALTVIAMACLSTSCKKSEDNPTPSVTKDYVYEVTYNYYFYTDTHYSPTSADVKSLNAHFETKGIAKLDSQIRLTMTGSTEAECDQQAAAKIKEQWNSTQSKLVVSEIKPKLQNMSELTYLWYRETRSDDGEIIYDTIGKWSCPVNENYAKYGELDIDGNKSSVTRSHEIAADNTQVTVKLFTENCSKEIRFHFKGLSAPVIPEGEVALAVGTNNLGIINYDNKTYRMEATVKFTKNGDNYNIVSSGKATTKDGSETINFTLNCTNVPF